MPSVRVTFHELCFTIPTGKRRLLNCVNVPCELADKSFQTYSVCYLPHLRNVKEKTKGFK